MPRSKQPLKKRRYEKQILKEPVKKAGKKVVLAESQKKYLKENYSTAIKDKSLSNDERLYINKIKAGKARSKQGKRYNGQYLSSGIVDIAKKSAKFKHQPVDKFIQENFKLLKTLDDGGYLTDNYFILTAVDKLRKSKKKFIEVNGERIPKREAIFRLTMFNNQVVSLTNTAAIEIKLSVNKAGKVKFDLPDIEEDDIDNDLFISDMRDEGLILHVSES